MAVGGKTPDEYLYMSSFAKFLDLSGPHYFLFLQKSRSNDARLVTSTDVRKYSPLFYIVLRSDVRSTIVDYALHCYTDWLCRFSLSLGLSHRKGGYIKFLLLRRRALELTYYLFIYKLTFDVSFSNTGSTRGKTSVRHIEWIVEQKQFVSYMYIKSAVGITKNCQTTTLKVFSGSVERTTVVITGIFGMQRSEIYDSRFTIHLDSFGTEDWGSVGVLFVEKTIPLTAQSVAQHWFRPRCWMFKGEFSPSYLISTIPRRFLIVSGYIAKHLAHSARHYSCLV
jgi:hypothetical protein